MAYLYVKSLHIFFIVAWFSGLFYLPRIFVNLAMAEDNAEYQRLVLMARKLFFFMTPLACIAAIFGFWLWLGFKISGAWLHAKLTLVFILVIYHAFCGKLYSDFAKRRNRRTPLWYRIFNEIPVFILLFVILLTVLKPF